MIWLPVLAALITIACAIAGQHFAYRAGQHRAHADWHGWLIEGWRIYARSGDLFTAFGTGRPPPTVPTLVRGPYDWEREGI